MKLADKQQKFVEEEFEALHEEAFMADLEARRMTEERTR